jgi:DNA-binding CsgD family transcriptional regulator
MWSATQEARPTHGRAIVGSLASAGPSEPLDLTAAQLQRVLDELGYGLLVVDGRGRLKYGNRLARQVLAHGGMLCTREGMLRGVSADIDGRLQAALARARCGQYRLLLGLGGEEGALAMVPLGHPLDTEGPDVLVLLPRQAGGSDLALRLYAHEQRLSPTEEAVLIALYEGMEVTEIARHKGVAVCTVRSQIKSMREKTGCSSVRQLLQRLNALPPMVCALSMVGVSLHPRNGREHIGRS